MSPKTYSRLWIAIAVVLVSVATGAALMRGRDPGNPESGQSGRRPTTATVTRQDFVRTVRLSGTVEAVESTTIAHSTPVGPEFAVARHHQAHQGGRLRSKRAISSSNSIARRSLRPPSIAARS